MKRFLSLLSTVAALAVAALALIMLLPGLAGFERYVILTGSMTGSYDAGSVVFAKPVPVAELETGDVITYAPPAGESPTRLVTHRIERISLQADGRRVFRTKGETTPNANQSQFNAAFGCAVDLLRGFNALAIVVELPESQLTRGQGNGQIGVWATVSR